MSHEFMGMDEDCVVPSAADLDAVAEEQRVREATAGDLSAKDKVSLLYPCMVGRERNA